MNHEKDFGNFYDLLVSHYLISSNAIVLLYALMHIKHICHCQNTISISLLKLAEMTNIKPSSLCYARNQLRSRRIINWEYMAGKGCTKYTLLPLDKIMDSSIKALWPSDISDQPKQN